MLQRTISLLHTPGWLLVTTTTTTSVYNYYCYYSSFTPSDLEEIANVAVSLHVGVGDMKYCRYTFRSVSVYKNNNIPHSEGGMEEKNCSWHFICYIIQDYFIYSIIGSRYAHIDVYI